jgi:hypothetical protein
MVNQSVHSTKSKEKSKCRERDMPNLKYWTWIFEPGLKTRSTYRMRLVKTFFRQVVGIIQIEDMTTTTTKQPNSPKETTKPTQFEEPEQVLVAKD